MTLTSLSINPVVLDEPRPGSSRGLPRLAPTARAVEILRRLAEMSQPFGTHIALESGQARIAVP